MTISNAKFRQILREETKRSFLSTKNTSYEPARERSYLLEDFDFSDMPGRALSSAFAQGAQKIAIKKVEKVAATALIKKIALFLGKSIPFAGDIVALTEASADALILTKNIVMFTRDLFEVSGYKTSDSIRAAVGEHIVFELSADDLRGLTLSLKKNMNEQQRVSLNERYGDILSGIKSIIINIFFALKEISAGTSYAAAIALSVLPVERGAKELFFKANELFSKAPEPIKKLKTIMNWVNGLAPLIPLIDFLVDNERVVAFFEIDKLITTQSIKDKTTRIAADTAAKVASEFDMSNFDFDNIDLKLDKMDISENKSFRNRKLHIIMGR